MSLTNEQILQEITKGKKAYAVVENGWFYSVVEAVFDTRQQALDYLGKTEEQLQKDAIGPHTNEGYWYHCIRVMTYDEIFNNVLEDKISHNYYENIDKIQKDGNDRIYRDGYSKATKNHEKLINGMIYYLEHFSNLNLLENYDERKKDFEEIIK